MKKILSLFAILCLGISAHAAGLLPSGSTAPATYSGNTVVNVNPGTGTIAAAVSAHGANTTYMLANGTYTENNISINANHMQFIGSGAPNVKIQAAAAGDPVFNVSSGVDFLTVWGVTIDLDDGNGQGIGGNMSDLLFQNVHVQNYSSIVSGFEDFPVYLFATGYSPNNLTVDHCQFTPATSGNVDGTSVIATGEYRPDGGNYTNVTLSNNLFDTPTDTGTTYYHCVGSAQQITGNVFVAPSFTNGMFWYEEAGSWNGNPAFQNNSSNTSTLSGNTVTLSANWDFAGCVAHANGNNDGLVITGNTIHGSSSTGSIVAVHPQACPTSGHAIASATIQYNTIDAGVNFLNQGCTIGSPLVTSPNNGVINPVQNAYSTPQSTAISTVSEAYPGAQTAGDLNVVAIGYGDTAGTTTISSVTDTKGNTYSLASGLTRGTGIAQSVYYCSNIASATAGANTVTVTFSGNIQYPDLRISEFTGYATSSSVDVTAAASGSATSASSGSATTTNATDLIFGAGYTTGAFSNPGSGFTTMDITNPDCDIHEYDIVTSTGSNAATATNSGSPWVMNLVSFKAASTSVIPSAPGTLSTVGFSTPNAPLTLTTAIQ